MFVRTLFFACCSLLLINARAQRAPGADSPDTEHLPGELLVMLRADATVQDLVKDLRMLDGVATQVQVMDQPSAPMHIWRLHFDAAAVAEARMLDHVRRHPAVELAQFNHTIQERTVPNDTQYAQQWHHQNIDSELAWNTTTGGTSAQGDAIVVCIVEGFDRAHPDLSANAWVNTFEIDNNGIDDDANGYIDDVNGWNPAANNDNTLFSGSHGTSCAGMTGARGNNAAGVAGANWNVKLMPVRIGSLTESNVIASYTYPLVQRQRWNSTSGAQGAFVVATSSSWGIDNGNPANYPLWCAFYNTLGTAGILSCGATSNSNVNVDVVGDMPTACSSPYMISVTATNSADQRTFSGYGATTIDVGAPGENVRTTITGNTYTTTSGTSFATPLTAGVIALLYSAPCTGLSALARSNPQGAANAVRTALFAGVEQVGNLAGGTVTGGRINSNNSLQYIITNCASYSPVLPVAAKVLLEGAYDAASGTMRDDLRAQGSIPVNEPFTAAGFTLVNPQGSSINPSVLTVTGTNAIVDWVLLEARNTPGSTVVAQSRVALVQRDGDVVGLDGTSTVNFSLPAGNYFIAVRHRNHLGVMTAAPIALSGTTSTLDFRSPAMGTYGTDAQKTVNSVRVMWAGEVFRNKELGYTGTDNDRDPILTAVGGTTPNNIVTGGYRKEDVNLDGSVMYTGAGNDRDVILLNVGSTTPNNTRAEQLP